MKNNYFLRKKISDSGKFLTSFLTKKVIGFFKFLFTERTVLFVTKQKIRSFTLGPTLQICLTLFFVLIGGFFFNSLRYDSVINEKSEELTRLKNSNSYFEEELNNMNAKLEKINEYLNSINKNPKPVKGKEHIFKTPKNIKEEDLSKKDKHTLNQLKNADAKIANIQFLAEDRIKKIENAILITGLNIKKMPNKFLQKKLLSQQREISLNEKNELAKKQGGPLVEDDSIDYIAPQSSSEDDLEKRLERTKFTNEIDYLIVLEKVAGVLPFAKPMKNYYISSGFGSRTDPITRRIATHQGLDFVGMSKEKIISPSEGKVVLAGKFSDYGNAIVIDHGFGITTRYGHLSAVKVKEGQIVKKGDLIALQGSSGRSTGAHLHYEIRYKNAPLNPRKFLEAGELLSNDQKNLKYVSS
jgi:murein DD-endopeptidase MepM/ murein hydrolase activator NlpD